MSVEKEWDECSGSGEGDGGDGSHSKKSGRKKREDRGRRWDDDHEDWSGSWSDKSDDKQSHCDCKCHKQDHSGRKKGSKGDKGDCDSGCKCLDVDWSHGPDWRKWVKVKVTFECAGRRLVAEGFKLCLDRCFLVLLTKEHTVVRIPVEHICFIEEFRWPW